MAQFTKQYVFLCYLNRSGSTYLAKKLSEFEAIDVGIEEDFIDGIKKGKVSIQNEQALEQYLADLSRTPKFDFWEIDLVGLKAALLEHEFPIDYRKVLFEIWKGYFTNSEAEVIIHKKGTYFKYYDQVIEVFPEAKFLFISRDPRAIYNSQKKALNSVKGHIMQEDVVKFAVRYKFLMNNVRQLSRRSNFYLLSYEDLMADESDTLGKILDFLKISNDQKVSNGDYFERIPADQRHLHKNVGEDKANTKRINAWKEELESAEIEFLEDVFDNKSNRFLRIQQKFYLRYKITYWKEQIKLILKGKEVE